EDDFKSHGGKLKNHFDLNKLLEIEDSFEIESEIIEDSLDDNEIVEDSLDATEIVEESDIESQEEERQTVIRRMKQIWHQKDAKENTEVDSGDCAPSTSGAFDSNENLHELNKDAEENDHLSPEREAVKNELINVLRIYLMVQ
ncbi:hypothetical protein A2U01_0049448, partial [Trifolium medium]|nr:hypothetical protein [Trifolium medium]